MISKKILLFLFSFFLLRIVYSYFFGWQQIPSGSDGISYNGYALAILNKTDWLTNPSFHGDYRAPGYPLFLALIYSIFGAENLFAVNFFQAIIGTLTVYYIFKLSSSIFCAKKSFLTLFWAGLYFFYIWYTGRILRDTLVFFLLILAFYHIWCFFKNEGEEHFLRSKDLWKFMIVFTILLHTDERYLFYIPFISILFIIYRKNWVGIKQYLWFSGIIILLLIPWLARNYVAYNGFVLINTRTLDMRQKPISEYSKYLSDKKIEKKQNKDYPSDEERELVKKGKNPNSRSSQEIEIIKKNIYAPSTFIKRKLYRFKEMWIPFRFWSDYEPFPKATFRGPWSLRHNLLSILFYGTLIPFVFYALFYLFKLKNKAVWFLIFPIVVHTVLHFLMWGRERYRLPIDAFIIILGCYGIVACYVLFKNKLKPLFLRFNTR